jgi:hypothetical protein
MKQIKFSRAGKRRFNRRVDALAALLKQNDKLFRREWHKQLRGWLGEIHRRAKNWREAEAKFRGSESPDGLSVEGKARIFGIVEIAETMLAACCEKAEKEIEAAFVEETRRLLTNECVKAVAYIYDRRLNYLIEQRVYRQAKY